jgi:putative redox protein
MHLLFVKLQLFIFKPHKWKNKSIFEYRFYLFITISKMTSTILYEGNLRTTAKHIYSGHIVETDAPLDNQGLAERFSPTDLVATALGSCMLTIMGIAARTHDIIIEGTTMEVEKIMVSDPRRIGAININIQFPKNYTDKEVKILEKAALNCPVYHSLSNEVIKNIIFLYPKD